MPQEQQLFGYTIFFIKKVVRLLVLYLDRLHGSCDLDLCKKLINKVNKQTNRSASDQKGTLMIDRGKYSKISS